MLHFFCTGTQKNVLDCIKNAPEKKKKASGLLSEMHRNMHVEMQSGADLECVLVV